MKLRLLLSLSFILLQTACINKSTRETLNDIETFIHERPDSALSVLESIRPECLRTKRLNAQFSLLYSTALDKNYIDTTNLDVIRPALNYYSRHGSSSEKMRAYFYQGCIFVNRGEDDKALYSYLLALEDSSLVQDNHYKELVNSAISDIFSRNHNIEQELYYTQNALKYGQMAGDSVGVWAITGHLASCYANLGKWEDADSAYESYFAMPIYDSLAFARREICFAKDLLRESKPDPLSSIGIIQKVASEQPDAMTLEAYCIYAYAQQILGDEHAADGILHQLESISPQQDVIKPWRYRIKKMQGQYRQALTDLEQTIMAQDSLVLSSLRQSLIQSQRDYLQAQTVILKKENELKRQHSIIVIVASLLIIALVIFLYFRRKAIFSKKIAALSSLHQDSQRMLELQSLKAESINSQLEKKDAALLSLRKQYATLYKAKYRILNDLCSAYLSPIKKDRKDMVYEEAMRQMDIIINDADSQMKFMKIVNNSLDNILDKLRMDLPNHKESDIHFLMFIIVGFDATTISNLTGYSVGTVYTKKNRLKGEITSLSSPYKDFYLEYIN